jgi:hypothetical protein
VARRTPPCSQWTRPWSLRPRPPAKWFITTCLVHSGLVHEVFVLVLLQSNSLQPFLFTVDSSMKSSSSSSCKVIHYKLPCSQWTRPWSLRPRPPAKWFITTFLVHSGFVHEVFVLVLLQSDSLQPSLFTVDSSMKSSSSSSYKVICSQWTLPGRLLPRPPTKWFITTFLVHSGPVHEVFVLVIYLPGTPIMLLY